MKGGAACLREVQNNLLDDHSVCDCAAGWGQKGHSDTCLQKLDYQLDSRPGTQHELASNGQGDGLARRPTAQAHTAMLAVDG